LRKPAPLVRGSRAVAFQRDPRIQAGARAGEAVGAQFAFKAGTCDRQQARTCAAYRGIIGRERARGAQLVEGAVARRGQQVAARLRRCGLCQQRAHATIALRPRHRRMQACLRLACMRDRTFGVMERGCIGRQRPGLRERGAGIVETEIGRQSRGAMAPGLRQAFDAALRGGIRGIDLQQHAITRACLVEPATARVLVRAPARLVDGGRQPGLDARQVGVTRVIAARSGDQARRGGDVVALQRAAGLLQQIRKRILATFQRLDKVGLQRKHALVERKRGIVVAIESVRRARGGGARQQRGNSGVRRFALSQLRGDGIGLPARNGQFLRQAQRRVRLGIVVHARGRARLCEGGLAHAHQADAGVIAIRVDRQRGVVQLAGATAIGGGEPAMGERDRRLVAQRLRAGFRPQPVAQRTPQRDHEHRQHQRTHDRPALPGTHATDETSRGRCAHAASIRDRRQREDRVTQARRARSTPGSPSSLPSSRDSRP